MYICKIVNLQVICLVRNGRYVEQLAHFTDYFRRDQILVINSGLVFRNSSAVMEIVAKFLGIDTIPEWYGPFPHDDHISDIRGILIFYGFVRCC